MQGLRRIGARDRDQRGAAAVEFGLVALLLFTLLFGIIQFGLWFWAWQTGGHAAREAARFAAVNPCDDAAIEAKGVSAMSGAPVEGTPTWDVAKPTTGMKVGDDITVEVTFETINLEFFPFFAGSDVKAATARIERVPAGGC